MHESKIKTDGLELWRMPGVTEGCSHIPFYSIASHIVGTQKMFAESVNYPWETWNQLAWCIYLETERIFPELKICLQHIWIIQPFHFLHLISLHLQSWLSSKCLQLSWQFPRWRLHARAVVQAQTNHPWALPLSSSNIQFWTLEFTISANNVPTVQWAFGFFFFFFFIFIEVIFFSYTNCIFLSLFYTLFKNVS